MNALLRFEAGPAGLVHVHFPGCKAQPGQTVGWMDCSAGSDADPLLLLAQVNANLKRYAEAGEARRPAALLRPEGTDRGSGLEPG